MVDLAYKIKSLRALKGWSQDELAQRLGVSRSAIGNYEQGTRRPRIEDLEALADVFNCNISYLVGDDLTMDEINLLEKYRKLNFVGKKEVDRFIEYSYTKPEFRRESESDASSDVS